MRRWNARKMMQYVSRELDNSFQHIRDKSDSTNQE